MRLFYDMESNIYNVFKLKCVLITNICIGHYMDICIEHYMEDVIR